MRIAMIGLGFMGTTHLKALAKVPDVKLEAVVSDIPQQLTGDLSGVQGNLGGPGTRFDFSTAKKFSDYREALRDPDIDAVDICLPTQLHLPVATAALAAGKHVLCEKPMGRTAEECQAMVAAADKAGRILMVAQVIRFWPEYRALRELVASGRMGQIRAAYLRRRCGPPKWQRWVYDKSLSSGGAFDLIIHDVDFCLHLFGKPEAVSSIGYEDMANGVDWVASHFHYSSGLAVAVSGGWHMPGDYPFSMEYSVAGERGTAEFSSAGRSATYYSEAGAEPLAAGDTEDAYHAEIAYFVECCRTGVKPALCPPEQSAEAVRLALLMCEARSCPGQRVAV